MEEEKLLLEQLVKDAKSTIAKIKKQSKDKATIDSYKLEYEKNDRELRETQVGKIQKDKIVTGKEPVKAVRIPVKFAKKIVTTSTAFEVGEPVTLVASEENSLSTLFKQIWKINRIDSLIQKLVMNKKKETQSAIQFYISNIEPNGTLNKILVKVGLKAQAKEIKSKVLENSKGVMTPYFSSTGDMILFMWEYESSFNDKTIQNVEIWSKERYFYLNNSSGEMAFISNNIAHGFDRIPIVYVSQDEPEWFEVKELIDRYEVTLSKMGASNDYSAYPILMTFGEIKSLPGKDEGGKVINFPITPTLADGSTNPFPHGKAEFLTAENAVESQKLEIETIEKLIHYISSTPNLSFDNLKGLGAMSGVAIKLMFLDAIIKASINKGENRTMIERIINVIMSGMVKTTNIALAKQSQSLFFDIIFNSILPDDLKEAIDMAVSAKGGGVASSKTVVKMLGLVDDIDEELKDIEKDNASKAPEPATP